MVLALFFVADDELTWLEDDAGRIEIGNAGKSLMKVDPPAGEVHFLSLFERKFVPVDKERADKILALTAFYRQNPLAKGDEIALDYPLRDKVYHVQCVVTGLGTLTLPAWPEEAYPCAKLEGTVAGWGDDKETTVTAFVGTEGDLAGKILKISFKFTDWPLATLILTGCAK